MSATTEQRTTFSREAIAKIDDLKREWVDVPEWDGGCWVRGLSALERSKLERSMLDAKGNPNMAGLDALRARLVLFSAVTDAGERIFRDSDLGMIEGKSIQAVERIANVASRLSGLSEEAVIELAGKSEPTTNGSSPTDSPGT